MSNEHNRTSNPLRWTYFINIALMLFTVFLFNECIANTTGSDAILCCCLFGSNVLCLLLSIVNYRENSKRLVVISTSFVCRWEILTGIMNAFILSSIRNEIRGITASGSVEYEFWLVFYIGVISLGTLAYRWFGTFGGYEEIDKIYASKDQNNILIVRNRLKKDRIKNLILFSVVVITTIVYVVIKVLTNNIQAIIAWDIIFPISSWLYLFASIMKTKCLINNELLGWLKRRYPAEETSMIIINLIMLVLTVVLSVELITYIYFVAASGVPLLLSLLGLIIGKVIGLYQV